MMKMNEKEILQELLQSLYRKYASIDKKLPFYEENDSRYPILLNSQMKIVRAIQNCIAQLADPKRGFVSDKEWRKEFSNMMDKMTRADDEMKSKIDKVPLMSYKRGSLPITKRETIVRKSVSGDDC